MDVTGPIEAPYGSWASQISAMKLAQGAVGVSDLKVADGRIYWLENRPDEGGRLAIVTGDETAHRVLTPAGFNVRTRVHEYGGAAYAVIDGRVLFANFADQRLHAQVADGDPQPVTPSGYRYADLVAAPGGGLIAVREDHTDPADVKNAIVHLTGQPGDGGQVLFGESDFVAYPRVSLDGKQLAWMAWNHPNMPWDDTALYVADLTSDGLKSVRQVAGGAGESVMEPQWGANGSLFFISDRSGFWNLYVRRDETNTAIAPRGAEFAGPLWGLGQSNYALLADGGLVAICSDSSGRHLIVIEPRSGGVREIATPFTTLSALKVVAGRTITLLAGSADVGGAVIKIDLESDETTLVRRPSSEALPKDQVSRASAVTFPGAGGRPVHALFYTPTNTGFVAPTGEKPPLIVQVHGGPTGQASPAFSLANQFWTSRGFAIVDVDYGGSSGYGRAYRQRLNGRWGVVDVEDVVSAVRYLTGAGLVDPARVAIHGGSAGGFTVLAALAGSEVFKAGASFYGVADLGALARDTHKFESRYLDNLVGPYPEARAVYDERSPLSQLDGFSAPLIIFQGADDPIVPPNQAHMILDALRARGLPVAYLEFAGESHGFRKAETLIASKEAELYFYGRVFGFTPADELPKIEIENLPAA